MDYEKKIREYMVSSKVDQLYKNMLINLFPELAESKDERIRKSLLAQYKGFKSTDSYDEDITFGDVVTWLEKQGKKETDEWKEGNIIRRGGILALVIKGRRVMKSNGEIFTVQYPDEWVKAVPNEIEHFLNELEKQGEQKPVEHLELKAGHWYICHRAYCCRADHLTVKEGERFMCEKDGVVKGFVIKNPENYFKEVSAPAPLKDEYNLLWSEEDESNRITIVGELLNSQINAKPYEYATYDKLISWANYLKDRILSQPKQEWSEEDELMLESIIQTLKLTNGAAQIKIDWLKSLKDRVQLQNTWKPSEEQLRELENVFGDRSAGWDDKVVESLYNDLRALLK